MLLGPLPHSAGAFFYIEEPPHSHVVGGRPTSLNFSQLEGQVVQIIPSREDSLDRLVEENAQQFSDEQESVESVVLHKLEVNRLHTALSLLTPEERALIQALFFDKRKESELAVELGISQPAVYKRKMKILKKLKIFLEK